MLVCWSATKGKGNCFHRTREIHNGIMFNIICQNMTLTHFSDLCPMEKLFPCISDFNKIKDKNWHFIYLPLHHQAQCFAEMNSVLGKLATTPEAHFFPSKIRACAIYVMHLISVDPAILSYQLLHSAFSVLRSFFSHSWNAAIRKEHDSCSATPETQHKIL